MRIKEWTFCEIAPVAFSVPRGPHPCWVFQVFFGVVFLTASGFISPNVEAANDCNLRNVLDHYVFIMATLQGPFIMTIDLKIW